MGLLLRDGASLRDVTASRRAQLEKKAELRAQAAALHRQQGGPGGAGGPFRRVYGSASRHVMVQPYINPTWPPYEDVTHNNYMPIKVGGSLWSVALSLVSLERPLKEPAERPWSLRPTCTCVAAARRDHVAAAAAPIVASALFALDCACAAQVRWAGDHCCVCGSDVDYDCDQLVSCDACGVTCHQSCYGVQQLPGPTDVWLCRACELREEVSPPGPALLHLSHARAAARQPARKAAQRRLCRSARTAPRLAS